MKTEQTITGLIFTILIFSWGAGLFAQNYNDRFMKRYDAGIEGRGRMASIWPSDDGYFATMYKNDTTASGTMYWAIEAIRLDSNFDIVSRKTYGDTTQYYLDWYNTNNITPDGLGNFWVWSYCYLTVDASYHTYCGKFDKNGDLLFERSIPMTNPNDFPIEIVKTENGRGMLAQYTRTTVIPRTRLYFLDEDGQILKIDSIIPYSPGRLHISFHLSSDPEEREIYIPTSDPYYNGFYTFDYRPRLIVYDFQGNLLYEKRFFETFKNCTIGHVYRLKDNGFVAMTAESSIDSSTQTTIWKSGIVKLDSNMDFEFSKHFWLPKVYNAPSFFYRDSQGNFYMGGYWDTFPDNTQETTVAYLMKFNSDLDSLWVRKFQDNSDSTFRTVRFTEQIQRLSDGSLLHLVSNYPGIGKYSLLFKLDSCGFLIDSCTVDTIVSPPPNPIPPDTLWPQPNGQLLAYPNPSAGLFSLVWDVNVGDQSVLEIFDVAGRSLMTSKLQREERPSQLVLRNWANGVYLLRIRSEKGRVFQGKLIVLE